MTGNEIKIYLNGLRKGLSYGCEVGKESVNNALKVYTENILDFIDEWDEKERDTMSKHIESQKGVTTVHDN